MFGVLYLTDTAAEQGAFRLVPGFHRRLDAWLDDLGEQDPRSLDLEDEAVPIAGRAGDLIICRHDLPHGASPNRAGSPRLVQYLSMFPPWFEEQSVWR
jgi:ectoine hydroxylase-related dioxygenase (phytanoyl-CoA dioxygenase family)